MGAAVGEAITRAAELALETRTPLLAISASGGARMQEGCVSLMQMVKTSQAIARLGEEGVLFISLLTDPTFGGVSASYATLGDILIAEPGAHIGFAGPAVIEQTIRQKLPDGFQTAGFLDGPRDARPGRATREPAPAAAQHPRAPRSRRGDPPRGCCRHRPAVAGRPTGRLPPIDTGQVHARDPWDAVQLARRIERPRTLDYIGFVFDDFEELHGDRAFKEDPRSSVGSHRLGDLAVIVIGHQKGHTTSEMMDRNFGMPEPEGYRKAMRLMRYAARFGMPIVTLVDTPAPTRASAPRSAASRTRSPSRSC